MSDGSPPSRCSVAGVEHQFQHFCMLARLGLTGIGDQERLLLGHLNRINRVPAAKSLEVLSAAVQHDHDREDDWPV